ncbi:hypothetical protein ACVBGC_01945 [Burkholderia stagnalis]
MTATSPTLPACPARSTLTVAQFAARVASIHAGPLEYMPCGHSLERIRTHQPRDLFENRNDTAGHADWDLAD